MAFPSPMRGGARGGGTVTQRIVKLLVARQRFSVGVAPVGTPHPQPLPVKGRGVRQCPFRGFRPDVSAYGLDPAYVLRAVVAVAFIAAGLVLSGQGLYIHAKALLAQVLLERAFQTSLATGARQQP